MFAKPETRSRAIFALAMAGLSLGPTTAWSVTLEPSAANDDFGSSCILDNSVDVAFWAESEISAIGRQPCLPKPCIAQVSRVQLASIMGYAPRDTDWSAYIARYADVCVSETTGVWGDETADAELVTVAVSSRGAGDLPAPDNVRAFWQPFLRTLPAPSPAPVAADPSVQAAAPTTFARPLRANAGVRTGNGFRGFRLGGSGSSGGGSAAASSLVPALSSVVADGGITDPSLAVPVVQEISDFEPLAAVPLPAAIWLLLGGIVAIGGMRRIG